MEPWHETTFLARYDDTTPPSVTSWLADVAKRGLVPLLVLFALNATIGLFLVHGLADYPQEAAVNRYLQDRRTPTLDFLAMVGSTMGNVTVNILGCLVVTALVWIATRRWWMAVLPGLALTAEAVLHMAATGLVDRLRPPGVEQLDLAPPTAAFPSGHTGATLAQLLIVAFLVTRLDRRLLTALVWVAGAAYIAWVMWARLYQGMHRPTDVAMGFVNGVVCAVIAWLALRRDAGSNRPGYPRPRSPEPRA